MCVREKKEKRKKKDKFVVGAASHQLGLRRHLKSNHPTRLRV